MALFEDGCGDDVRTAYEDVRNDGSETKWAWFKYVDKKLTDAVTGTEYSDFLAQLTDADRGYAYVRFETGDEMSRRAKFAFITWIGSGVSPLKRAKVSTDKAFIKAICVNFGKEILAEEKSELKEEKVLKILESASGASYGTGR